MLARSFGGRIFFLHVLDLTPLYAYDSGGDIAAALSMLELMPENFESDWQCLSLQPGIGEELFGRSTRKKVVPPQRLLSGRQQFMRMQSSWGRTEEAV